MQTRSRPWLFLLFLALFFSTAPIVVLYTAGWRYSFEHGRILQTGILSIESIPRGAQIFLDGRMERERTPAVIDTVLPGDHLVELRREDSLPWKKNLTVESRQTTFAQTIILWIDALPELTDEASVPALGAGEPSQETLERIRVRTLQGQVAVNRQTPQGQITIAYLPPGTYQLRSAPQGWVLLQNEHSKQAFLIDESGKESPIVLSAKMKFFDWMLEGEPKLLWSDGFDVQVYHLKTHASETLTRVSHPITGLAWHPSGFAALYAQENGLFAIDLDARDGRILTPLAAGADIRDVRVDEDGSRVYFFGRVENKRGWFVRPL